MDTLTSHLEPAGIGAATLESHKAPIHIGSVSLNARNLRGLADFYTRVIGLDLIETRADRLSLGSGGVAYLHLIDMPQAVPPVEPAAGLFHTAFLLPSRAALGAWFTGAQGRGAPIQAASDHGVSEAFYLDDPEGNGIEVYADRDPALWRKTSGGYDMTTARMDVRAVAEDGAKLVGSDGRFPPTTRIGHVHLSVGNVGDAEQFYHDVLGFDITHRRPGGSFFSSGGYHHYIGANTWHSAGAPPRNDSQSGLAEVEFNVAGTVAMNALRGRVDGLPTSNGFTVRDPWSIALRFSQA